MKKISLSLALVGTVAALPYPEDVGPPGSSYNVSSAMEVVNALADGKLAHLFGNDNAQEQLENLARMFGAGPGKAGDMWLNLKDSMNPGYGKVSPAAGDASNKVELTSTYPVPGSKKVKFRYGPYLVPNMSKKNMAGEYGSLFNFPDEFEKPCEGSCTIFGLQTGLEYPDGKNANTDTGIFLHHMLLFNSGPTRSDPTCRDRDISIPHVAVGEIPQHSERIVAAGIEGGSFLFPVEAKVGYKLHPEDKFKVLMDIMNEREVDQKVYFTMIYEYLDGYAEGIDDIQPIWLDVRQCGTSEIRPPQSKNVFSIGADWIPDFSGEIIIAGGHVHDGGTNLKLSLDGKVFCDSKASYGGSKEFIAQTHGHTGARGKFEHLRAMSNCFTDLNKTTTLKSGQRWRIEGFYDFNQHKPSAHGDENDTIMGIALMYVRGRNPKVI